jgi:hypothetical protein
LMIGLVSAPSTNPGGRDQSLVRRSQTRHHDVRHWITSFPLLHLIQQMAPRSRGVKEIPPRAGQVDRSWADHRGPRPRADSSRASLSIGLFCRWTRKGTTAFARIPSPGGPTTIRAMVVRGGGD